VHRLPHPAGRFQSRRGGWSTTVTLLFALPFPWGSANTFFRKPTAKRKKYPVQPHNYFAARCLSCFLRLADQLIAGQPVGNHIDQFLDLSLGHFTVFETKTDNDSNLVPTLPLKQKWPCFIVCPSQSTFLSKF